MARVASFSSSGTPVGGRSTLAQLMAKKKMLAEQQGNILAPRQIESWTQGAAQLGQTLVNSLQQRGAAAEEASGREQFAQAMSGIDWAKGPTPEQMASVTALDPDAGMKLLGELAEQRRSAVSTLTPEEEVAAGLNPKGTYQRKATGEIGRVTEPETPETWVDIPAPPGTKEGTQWQQSTTTGEKKAVGGAGISISTGEPLPAEVAGRVGLGDEFLKNYPNVAKVVSEGGMTGVNYLPAVQFGRGAGGEAYREIQTGVDALRRGLSGAGIGVNEAADYIARYGPEWFNDAKTLSSKLNNLRADLLAVREAVAAGRKVKSLDELGLSAEPPPAPEAPNADPGTPEAPAAPGSMSQYRSGQTYTFEDGSKGTFKGGDPKDIANWEILDPGRSGE